MPAMMNDPSMPLGKRIGIYLFFLAHMAAFGTLTFYLAYHTQKGNIYGVGGIPIIAYVFFYLWLVINSLLGILMIHGWLETLALPFIPEPGTVGTHLITEFDTFPAGRHVLPGAFLVMMDVLGARHNQHRNRFVGWLFLAVSGAQILLARYAG